MRSGLATREGWTSDRHRLWTVVLPVCLLLGTVLVLQSGLSGIGRSQPVATNDPAPSFSDEAAVGSPTSKPQQGSGAAPEYSFRTYPAGSQADNWREFALGKPFAGCGEMDNLVAERQAVPEEFPLLLLIGQQKAGTTWFYDVLAQHPAVFTPEFLDRDEPIKEVHWLDGGDLAVSWDTDDTAAYMRVFTKGRSDEEIATLRPGSAMALDATPVICSRDSAQRAAALTPHAQLVVILRDPVARLISHFRMRKYSMGGNYCEIKAEEQGGTPPMDCPLPEIDDWLEERLAFAEQWPTYFYPDGTGGFTAGLRTWPEIHCGLPNRFDRKVFCSTLIAPQLAWWLAFFPPERFLIFTSDQLHDPANAKEAARQVLEHAGVRDPSPISDAMLEQAKGFVGRKPEEPDISHLIPRMRALFERPMAELTALINEHWPELHFTGIPDEI